MGQLPLVCLRQKLLLWHRDFVSLRQYPYDILKLLFIRRGKENRNAEAGHQRKLLLNRISRMKVVPSLLLVGKLFPHQMPPVGSGVNQHVLRLFLKPALNNGFQIFILYLKILKAQIIHVNNEFVISVFNLGNHLV